jgi:DNA-binding MarR family transcriptional regulator
MTDNQPERTLLLDLYAAFHKSGQIVEAAVDGSGISAEDFAFVSIVGLREPVTPTAISREFGHSLSTVLFRAGRNVDLGFVERIANPGDGRSFLLRLTPAGRDAWRLAATNLWRVVERLQARLSRPAEEVQQVLRELQDAFDEEGAGARAARG